MHSTKGLLEKVSGAYKASDNTYLVKSSNINNRFAPSVNIALNAIGYAEDCNEYYKDVDSDWKWSYYYPVYGIAFVNNQTFANYGGGEAAWVAGGPGNLTCVKNSTHGFLRGPYQLYDEGYNYYRIKRFIILR